ncbi:MAG TPA: cobyric acid synthase [Candidatus Limnocylindria bacterium]|nr:cobyric acid synthase [Candidatus Limnocylindria bacterium]
MSARALMVLGTASHVGKSTIVAALCRIFADDGYGVAPFKAQNMSLNAAVTPDGREIGRAQAVQAECARRAAEVEMNPILLKPSGDRRSQVILEGAIWDDVDAWDYHRRRTVELFPRVVAAYERLAARSELIVLEGAGSPAEINLKDGDLVNLRMAAAAGAPCLLIADIDRGGSFAALAGTLALLEPHERARIGAFAITKFRGDLALLRPGIVEMERRLGIPCAGVVPWIDALGIDEEDGYGPPPAPVRWPEDHGPQRRLRIAVPVFPHLANATDLDALAAEPCVALRRVTTPRELDGADVVLLAGSKETVADLRWLREHGFAEALCAHARTRPIVGICGGMQMLGERIDDPLGIECGGSATGLGLLPIVTELTARKTTVPVRGVVDGARFAGQTLARASFVGYEIHVGVSRRTAGDPFATLRDAHGVVREDGARSDDELIAGTYTHGLFDDDAFRHAMLDALRVRAGLAPANARAAWRAEREARYDRLAAIVRASLDVPLLARLAGLPARVA